MITSEQRRPGHVDALPERQRAEQRGLAGRRRTARPVRRCRRRPGRAPGCPAAPRIASAAARAARIEENSPSVRPPHASIRSAISSSCGSRSGPVAAGWRQVGGDVEDAGLAWSNGEPTSRPRHAGVRRPDPRRRPSRRTTRPRSASPRSAPRWRCRTPARPAGRPRAAGPPAAPAGRTRRRGPAPPALRGAPRGRARPRRCGRGWPAEGVQHPGGGVGDLAERGDRLGAGGGGLGVGGCGVDGGAGGGGGVAQRGQVGAQFVVEDSRCGRAAASWIAEEKVATAASSRWASSGSTSRAVRRTATPSGAGRQFAGGHRGDPVGEFVGLVDDQEVVFGQHAGLGDRVDGQQRVVGHHDVGFGGLWRGPSRRSSRCRTGSGSRPGIPAPRR